MAIGEEPPPTTTVITDYCISTSNAAPEKRHRSVFELPTNFFDFSRVLPSPHFSIPSNYGTISENYSLETLDEPDIATDDNRSQNVVLASRLTCNTCEVEFQSLKDQRSHFKSDIHRFNVKLCLAGKKIVKEDDFDELTSDSFKDCDVSSISGSEDEAEKEINSRKGPAENVKQKLFVRLQNGLRVSVWRCLVVNESDDISFEDEKTGTFDNVGNVSRLRENEVVNRFKNLIQEPRDNTRLRIVLLASGGHFAGCVFDGNLVVAHKTFHRYVVRAKAGKKQSSKDASGKTVHSAGAALRRYNEQALRKEIQELLISWKPYFDASAYVFLHAPSSNRLLIFNGEKPCFSHQHCAVRNVPMIVRRPTLKEARRVYDMLTQISYEVDEERINLCNKEDSLANEVINCNINAVKEKLVDDKNCRENSEACPSVKSLDEITSESETEVIRLSTPLHEAAKSGDAPKILELLEYGLDPCIKDERGRTPYMLASEKEVRNAFRKFMALNLDKWDWHDAKVPSALTKELEESQAAKQAEKAAKKKAREKELKKLRKEKQKKAQAQAAVSQNASRVAQVQVGTSSSQSGSASKISKEEELKREREKRAAAAERRIAAATNVNSQGNNTVITPSSSQSKSGIAGNINCSCCNASLAGKVPFHRYNYKYCSTSCMHVHREILEDG